MKTKNDSSEEEDDVKEDQDNEIGEESEEQDSEAEELLEKMDVEQRSDNVPAKKIKAGLEGSSSEDKKQKTIKKKTPKSGTKLKETPSTSKDAMPKVKERKLGGDVKSLEFPKTHTSHYMVETAIKNLNDNTGSSVIAIKKYIDANFGAPFGPRLKMLIKKAIVKGVATGKFTRKKGIGATGSFKLSKEYLKKEQNKTKSLEKKKLKEDKENAKKKVSPKLTAKPKVKAAQNVNKIKNDKEKTKKSEKTTKSAKPEIGKKTSKGKDMVKTKNSKSGDATTKNPGKSKKKEPLRLSIGLEAIKKPKAQAKSHGKTPPNGKTKSNSDSEVKKPPSKATTKTPVLNKNEDVKPKKMGGSEKVTRKGRNA